MALGRGLGEILSEVEEAYAKDLSTMDSSELEAQGVRIADIEVASISPNPFQPRKHFDEQALRELSESIKEHGLLQPIVVIEKDDGYMLIAGERRLRAHKLADIPTVKAVIADVDMDEIRLRELALIENIQRENLNPIELANSYAELIEVHGIRHEDLSDIVHKSRSQITNTMRLLTLSEYAQKQLLEGNISQGHAKVLVGLDAPKQKRIIDTIIGQKLSVREAEKIVKNHKSNHDKKLKSESKTVLMDEYKKEISALLPFSHKIKSKSVEISFSSPQEIENFLSILKKA
ncbi:ParB/RepB/Spo0J family partition protein [Sulfurovum sp.]|uniref:ParB/RepB/Spo0J family partition protein n=1 Tax=Sulfurovum sp. TaxID=1969726 RepID=UPI002A3588C0|nr:ParB/RepB/Spo0J family partition protein [Sulfurovum sp.]MDD2450771.1 ParB/RepB/Spo0J family partition protein [Sulfurovum sp.]MDD3498963.1 ParB/RepB/Spo0J family partition protein [Sulfurovum sp.]MDY0402515.1 ParB/RepB/Spo0J family partition protein [Sulfurovum sp.]